MTNEAKIQKMKDDGRDEYGALLFNGFPTKKFYVYSFFY